MKNIFIVLFLCIFQVIAATTTYPKVVYPEDYDYESKELFNGEKVTLTPQWIQKADFLGDETAENYFAVGGEYFYVYHKGSDKLLRFDKANGLINKELTINFGDYTHHDISFFGSDDAGNLFVSSGCDLKNVKLKYPELPSLIISIINSDGAVVKQLRSKDNFSFYYTANNKENGNVYYDRLSIKGDITTESNFLVSLPLVAKVVDRNEIYIGSSVIFFHKAQGGDLISIEDSQAKYKAMPNVTKKENIKSVAYCPIYWLDNTKISEYKGTYFYAVTHNYNENKPIVSKLHNVGSADFQNILTESLGFEGDYKPGSIICKYGDNDIIVDANVDADDFLHFNIREISYKVDYGFTDVNKSVKLWSIPQSEQYATQTVDFVTPVTIQAVETKENGKPRTDIYFYAPGKIIGCYTLYDGVVSTGVPSVKIKNSGVLSYNNGYILVSKDSAVSVYDICGRLHKTINVAANQMLNISDLQSGIYFAKVENEIIKIAVK